MVSLCLLVVLLLLAVAVTSCGRRHHIKKGTGLLVGESEDDVRDNVFNYDEQGGGEEDEVRLHTSHVKRRGLNHPVVCVYHHCIHAELISLCRTPLTSTCCGTPSMHLRPRGPTTRALVFLEGSSPSGRMLHTTCPRRSTHGDLQLIPLTSRTTSMM